MQQLEIGRVANADRRGVRLVMRVCRTTSICWCPSLLFRYACPTVVSRLSGITWCLLWVLVIMCLLVRCSVCGVPKGVLGVLASCGLQLALVYRGT